MNALTIIYTYKKNRNCHTFGSKLWSKRIFSGLMSPWIILGSPKYKVKNLKTLEKKFLKQKIA